jgi:sulfate adenylyltransferase
LWAAAWWAAGGAAVGVEEAAALAVEGLPGLVLTAAERADLRALATGAYSPLVGFMGAKQHQAVVESMRLPDGVLWPIPVCLGLPEDSRVDGGRLLLRDQGGGLLGVLEVTEVFEHDRELEAELVYGTSDPAHPGWLGCWVRPGWRWRVRCRRRWRPWTAWWALGR